MSGRVRRSLEPVRRQWRSVRERRAQRSLRVRPLAAGFWMLLAAGAAAAAIWVTTAWLLDTTDQALARDPKATGADRAKVQVEAIRTGLAAGAGAGAAVGLMLAFRRQRHTELATALSDLDATERRVTELYNAAATQLGSDKAPVRLTALHTLERLANANEGHRQTIVNIICAYLRMPYTPPTGPDPADGQRQAARRYRARRLDTGVEEPAAPALDLHEERQVRLTAQRILHTHLQPDATSHWADIDLDLTGATLIDFTLADCHLHTATFTQALFIGSAWFDGAKIGGEAWFNEAEIDGDTWFSGAEIGGNARFSGAKIGGRAWFNEAKVGGDVWFGGAKIGGDAWFGGAKIGGDARFCGAKVSGEVSLKDIAITGALELEGLEVADRSRPHELLPGWRIEPGEGTTGRVVAEAAPGA